MKVSFAGAEEFLQDIFIAHGRWDIALIRYFNLFGAHDSGLVGEDPNDIPDNLMPYISQVFVGKFGKPSVFGGAYDTPDGTCVRNYVHVVVLAKGYSRLDVIKAVEKASGK